MIGVFDSGVGGLTVVKEIFKYLPQYQIIYFGDTARLPYGTKGADFVRRYSEKITKWLINKGAKTIVIACHTSSAWAADSLKKKYKGIPIFDMINSVAKEVAEKTKNKKIGIIGTPGTIKSNSWNRKLLKIDRSLGVFSASCPLFVPLVEMGFTKGEVAEKIAREYFKNLKAKKIDTLVLACTHYPLMRKTIEKVINEKVYPVKSCKAGSPSAKFNRVNIINPARSVAEEIKIFFQNTPGLEKRIKKGKNHQFFFSDKPYNLEKISRLCFGKKIKVTIKDPF